MPRLLSDPKGPPTRVFAAVEAVRSARAAVLANGEKIAALLRDIGQAKEDEKAFLSADLSSPTELQRISQARLRSELLPKQLEATEEERGILVETLKGLLNSFEREIRQVSEIDQNKLVDEICELLKPYSGGSPEEARTAAARLPAVVRIAAAATWTTTAPAADRAINPASYDGGVLAHAGSLLALADTWARNGGSFVPNELRSR